jgi:hypothetical protein
MTFSLSQNYDYYEREVFTLFDMFGIIGGVYEILTIVGYFMVKTVSSKLLYQHVLSKLYTVDESVFRRQNNSNSRAQVFSKKPFTCISSKSSVVSELNEREEQKDNDNSIRIFKEEEQKDHSKPSESFSKSFTRVSKTRSKESEDALEKLCRSMKSRRKYSYTAKNIIYLLLCCLKPPSKRLSSQELHSRLYLSGVSQLKYELDWVSLIKSLRELKLLTHITWTKQDISSHLRTLSLFHRDSFIPSPSPGKKYLQRKTSFMEVPAMGDEVGGFERVVEAVMEELKQEKDGGKVAEMLR